MVILFTFPFFYPIRHKLTVRLGVNGITQVGVRPRVFLNMCHYCLKFVSCSIRSVKEATCETLKVIESPSGKEGPNGLVMVGKRVELISKMTFEAFYLNWSETVSRELVSAPDRQSNSLIS